MNAKGKGEKAQTIIIGELAKYGITCLYPLSDNLPFDFVAYKNGKMKKIQVKSSELNNKSGAKTFKLRTTNWNKGTQKGYTVQDCDYIILYDHEWGSSYIVGPNIFSIKHNIDIRREPSKNNQKKGIHMHDDYVINQERIEGIFA